MFKLVCCLTDLQNQSHWDYTVFQSIPVQRTIFTLIHAYIHTAGQSMYVYGEVFEELGEVTVCPLHFIYVQELLFHTM